LAALLPRVRAMPSLRSCAELWDAIWRGRIAASDVENPAHGKLCVSKGIDQTKVRCYRSVPVDTHRQSTIPAKMTPHTPMELVGD